MNVARCLANATSAAHLMAICAQIWTVQHAEGKFSSAWSDKGTKDFVHAIARHDLETAEAI